MKHTQGKDQQNCESAYPPQSRSGGVFLLSRHRSGHTAVLGKRSS